MSMDREIDIRVRHWRTARRASIAAVAVTAAVAVSLAAPDWLRPSVSRTQVRFGSVERGNLEATVRASGHAVAAFERVVTSPVDGRVLRKLSLPGAILEPGDRILELDTSAVELELEKLEEHMAQVSNERKQRELELKRVVRANRRDGEARRLDLEIAAYQLEQVRALNREGLATESALLEAQARVRKSEIEVERVEEELTSARLLHAARVESLELDTRIIRHELENNRQELELARTEVDQPVMLTWVVEEIGSTVRRGDLLARTADPGAFRIEATVSDSYAPRLVVGQRVRVLASERELVGTLATILPAIENGAVRFTVELEDPTHASLRHNLRVDVLVVTGFRSAVLKVPRGAYIRGGGQQHQVFVVRDDRAVRTEVRLGLAGYEHYELVAGLEEGDRVILSDLSDKIHARQLRLR